MLSILNSVIANAKLPTAAAGALTSTFFSLAIGLLTVFTPTLASAGTYDELFSGAYAGIDFGTGTPDIIGGSGSAINSKGSSIYGVQAGYNKRIMRNRWLIGLEGYYHKNKEQSVSLAAADSEMGEVGEINFGADTYGVDLRLGYPTRRWMPYLRVGYGGIKATGDVSSVTGSSISTSMLHYGLGMEFAVGKNWTVGGEYTNSKGSSKEVGGTSYKLEDNAFLLQLRYYLSARNASQEVEAPEIKVSPNATSEPPPQYSFTANNAAGNTSSSSSIFQIGSYDATTEQQVAEEPPQQPCSANLVLPGKTSFAFNRAGLTTSATNAIREFVGVLQRGNYSGLRVLGYSDRLGDDAYNQQLSLDRALSVKSYLSKFMPENLIQAEGRGEADPKTEGQCKQTNRKQLIECLEPDRRVEVVAVGKCN